MRAVKDEISLLCGQGQFRPREQLELGLQGGGWARKRTSGLCVGGVGGQGRSGAMVWTQGRRVVAAAWGARHCATSRGPIRRLCSSLTVLK